MRTLAIYLLGTVLAVTVLTVELAHRPTDTPTETVALEHGPTPDLAAVRAQIAETLAHLPTTTTVPPDTPRAPVRVIPADGNVWDALAACECGGNWGCNTGNGYGGGLQFAHTSAWSTWRAFGGTEYAEHPWEASRDEQVAIGERVLASSGWGAWPGCARLLGLL